MVTVSGEVFSDAEGMRGIADGLRSASTTVSDMSSDVGAAPGLADVLGVVGSSFSAVFGSATQQYADALTSLAESFAILEGSVLGASKSYREGDDTAAASLLGVAP